MTKNQKVIHMLREAIAFLSPNGLQSGEVPISPVEKALYLAYRASEPYDPKPLHYLGRWELGVDADVPRDRRMLSTVSDLAHEVMGFKPGDMVRALRGITEGGTGFVGDPEARFPSTSYLHALPGDVGVVESVSNDRWTVRFTRTGTATLVDLFEVERVE